jgi:elongation factor P--beta-lysine ligase
VSFDGSPNPREHIGANHGPEIDAAEFTPATDHQKLIAQCAKFIGLVLQMDDADRITMKRQMPRWLIARKLLFFCLQEERPFGDSAGEVRYGHLAQVEIQNALGIYRKTIGQDVQEVQAWCDASVEFEAHMDSIRDGMDAVVALYDYPDRIMELASKISGRALERIKKAADMLEVK